MDEQSASQSLGARMIWVAQMAVAMHASMDLLSKQSPTVVGRQQAMTGGTGRCVTDDAQSFVAGEKQD